MGDRVSIQFGSKAYGKDNIWLSAVLCHYWGGRHFPNEALRWAVKMRNAQHESNISTSALRLDPDTAMVMFVQSFPDSRSLRLVPTKDDCDNSDNGHFIIWVDSLTLEEI